MFSAKNLQMSFFFSNFVGGNVGKGESKAKNYEELGVVNNYRQLADNLQWGRLSQSVPTILFNNKDQTQNCLVLLA